MWPYQLTPYHAKPMPHMAPSNQVHATPGQSVGLNATDSPFQISKGAAGCIRRGNLHDGRHQR